MSGRILALGVVAAVTLSQAAGQAQSARAPIGLAWQLTHSANYDPSFAPDGKRMIYISVLAGREQLFVRWPGNDAIARVPTGGSSWRRREPWSFCR